MKLRTVYTVIQIDAGIDIKHIISFAHYRASDKEAMNGLSGNSSDKIFKGKHLISTQIKKTI